MNPFLKKEARLLLPSWLAVMALAVILPWLFQKDVDTALNGTPMFLFFGTILLAVDCFGREFSLGTFSGLMSQPIERGRIWRTKITLLFGSSALIFLGYFISCQWLVHQALQSPEPRSSLAILGPDLLRALYGGGIGMLIALAGGLWTTLLFRQISAAFWITFLIPLGSLMLLILVSPERVLDSKHFTVLLAGLGVLYCVAGFWLAHRLFHRSQDVAWTGGVVDFSRWRYFEARSGKSVSAVSARRHRPIVALFKKEFQLHSISLFCVGALLVLHIGVFFMRGFYSQFHRDSIPAVISEFFWSFWLVVPMVIGCMAVAEERKLGVMESQFCLPVSRRGQFLIKFVPAMIAGVVFGGVMPLFLELVASWVGVPNTGIDVNQHGGHFSFSDLEGMFVVMLLLSAGLALVGFFASSLARNFLQALSIGIVSLVAFSFLASFFTAELQAGRGELITVGKEVWGTVLPVLIGALVIVFFIPWLSYRNFSHYVETGRLWRRTIFSLVGALLFVLGVSALVYNRVWEIFEPVERPHGVAKLSEIDPPALQLFRNGVQVRLPDGRVWFDSLGEYDFENGSSSWRELWSEYVRPLPTSLGPEQVVTGSNWVALVPPFPVDWGTRPGYLDTVGIQSDGTLWISSEAGPADGSGGKMVQFGDETNWQQIVQVGLNFVLLKNNGTLWQWGTNTYGGAGWQTNWTTVRHVQPRQLGTDSDWKNVFGVASHSDFAQKTNGSLRILSYRNRTNNIEPEVVANLTDKIAAKDFAWLGDERTAYVGTDGTLWVCNRRLEETDGGNNGWKGSGFVQVGSDTNWAGVTVTWDQLIALRTDGSLWQWKFPEKNIALLAKVPPKRMGIHSDWRAVKGFWTGTVALAADGGLWFWPSPEFYDGALLKARKQPELLANVFGKND